MVERRRQLTERHIPFIYDIGQSASQFGGDEICRFIEAASCIAASRYEMELITQKTRYKTADITAMGKSLVVTDGERGSTVHTPAGELTVPAVPVHAVDPVGAGDAFRGGILYGLVHKFDWETTLRLGSVMASFKVENQGAQNYSATQAQIRARFESAYGQSVNL
jgi:adenosine kinase